MPVKSISRQVGIILLLPKEISAVINYRQGTLFHNIKNSDLFLSASESPNIKKYYSTSAEVKPFQSFSQISMTEGFQSNKKNLNKFHLFAAKPLTVMFCCRSCSVQISAFWQVYILIFLPQILSLFPWRCKIISGVIGATLPLTTKSQPSKRHLCFPYQCITFCIIVVVDW